MSKKTIYFKSRDGNMTSMMESEYDSEDLFQKLLADYPDLLSGSNGLDSQEKRWLLVAREAAIPDNENSSGRWSLDHFYIDQDYLPTLVEVKRSSDTRLRREVIGQMFDYAANAVNYWSRETLESFFEKTCAETDQVSDQLLIELFGTEDKAQIVWDEVHKNLRVNRLRLVFVADAIPDELVRIIEFMNETMPNIEVLGIEVAQYIGEGGKVYVPRVVGYTATAAAQKTATAKGPGTTWNLERYKLKLTESGVNGLPELFDRIYSWAETESEKPLWWGKGRTSGCFAPSFKLDGRTIWPVYFYTGQNGAGYVQLAFQNLLLHKRFESPESREQLVDRLNSLLGVSISKDKINAWPSFPLSLLLDDQKFKDFTELMQNLDQFK